MPKTVSAPTASDLAKYVEGVEGSGTLMARFTTTQGVINCELFEKGAPLTVANFVGLARGMHPFMNAISRSVEQRPFYDGLIFHRVIPNFMIQGGDPAGLGSGGPGYKFANETSDALKHDRPGILSMANSGPNTNGSQFFITEMAKPYLDGGYNVFGECMDIDVVGKIARVDKRGSRPTNDVVMNKVEIFRDDIKKYPKKPFSGQ
jgi:cyclophilin family peptidyl-prolyl cis-trans isomerase